MTVKDGSAALVFLILYAILLVVTLFAFGTRRVSFCHHIAVLVYIIIRLAAQALGFAFSILTYEAVGLHVAYTILTAEGYFILVSALLHYIIAWQIRYTKDRQSWIVPPWPPGTPFLERLKDCFCFFGPKRRPMFFVQFFLNSANGLIIGGGSLLGSGISSTTTLEMFQLHLLRGVTPKAMRGTGQALLLCLNLFMLYCVIDAMRQWRRERPDRPVHPTLQILLIAGSFLVVRGVYGVLGAVLPAFNYFSPNNYDEGGLTQKFLISEYLLGATMECLACLLLMYTYFTSRDDPPSDEPALASQENVEKSDKDV
jgi:hypothetical protein